MRTALTPGRMKITPALTAAAVTVAIIMAAPASATTSCRVVNHTTGTTSRHLQPVIDAASPQDVIFIKGVCAGNFVVGKSLRFVGKATSSTPEATLDGRDSGTVVTVNDAVVAVFKDVVITNGNSADQGGGINVAGGTLTLSGDSRVKGNQAAFFGGGIENSGTVLLTGHARVSGNTASVSDGGITGGGALTMSGYSQVNGNTSTQFAGGIGSTGTVTLNEYAQVDGNHAGLHGGGIVVSGAGTLTLTGFAEVANNTAANKGGGIATENSGSITLKDSASVTGNTAGVSFGGVYDLNNQLFGCNGSGLDQWIGAISPNTPDDPPAVTLVTC